MSFMSLKLAMSGTADLSRDLHRKLRIQSARRTRARLIVAAAAVMSTVALTGTSAQPHHDDCTPVAPSAPCTQTDGSSLSTAPKKLNVLPHSDDPRWLALGYNPKWPRLGYNPKWQGFGYEPQYNGFQPSSRSAPGGVGYTESYQQ